MYCYSPSTGGFYASSIHGNDFPNDAIELEESQYLALSSAAASGRKIVVNGQGKVVAEPISSPSIEERLTQGKLTALADIEHYYAKTVQHLVGNPTQVEKDTWTLKLGTAHAVITGDPLDGPQSLFLEGAGLQTPASQETWARAVLRKAQGFAQVVGIAERMRETARKAVEQAQDQAAIDAVLVEHRALAERTIAQRMG